MTPKLGFVGLGRMGRPMARRLIEAGYQVRLFDLNTSAVADLAGPRALGAGSLRELGAASEIVFLSLPSPTAVVEAAISVAQAGAVRIIVDLSTTGAKTSVELAATLSEHGVHLVDAPVSGGIAGAREGTLSLLVAGSKEAVAEASVPLAVLGRIFTVGSQPGSGQTVKLVNNLLNACAIAITAEGMAFATKAGLDPTLVIDVVNASTGRNSATQDKWPRAVLPRTFDFGFAIGLCLKDIRLCIEEAASLDVELPLGSLVRAILERTAAQYGLESDVTSVALIAESDAKLNLQGKPT